MTKAKRTTARRPAGAHSHTHTHTPTHGYLTSVTPTPSNSTLYPYSHSRITNIASCPTFGVVHNQRQYPRTSRVTPLEAGGAMHQVFAGIRLWQLEYVQKLPKHARANAARLEIPYAECVTHTTDPRDNLIEFAFNVLHVTGYEDDPFDKVRTMSNMERATMDYCDDRLSNMENWPIWVKDRKNANSLVGIEQPFDVILTFSDNYQCRYIGTIDGLVWNENQERAEIDENKTAARLDDAWRNSFDMSMQITGYMACSTTVFGFPVLNSRVTGLNLRPSANFSNVLSISPISRDAAAIRHWGAWVRYGTETFEKYKDNYEDAPRFAHACNRYFRSCALMPFCCDTPDGRKMQFADMEVAPRSPSEIAVLGE